MIAVRCVKWEIRNIAAIADQTSFSDRHSRIAVDEDGRIDECPGANPNGAGLCRHQRNWSVHAANPNVVSELDRAKI